MTIIRTLTSSALVLLASVLASCGASAPEPLAPDAPAPVYDISPLCLPGCTETDPNPSQPGIFLTSFVTPDQCIDAGQNDIDRDGIGDRCERDIAAAFAPHLAITGSDRTGRESKWAAKVYPSGIVRVAYFLSYYTDDGPSTSWCNNNIIDLFDRQACPGHFGDSEIIVLDVYYSVAWKHWVLDCATYSAHRGYNLYCRGTAAYPSLVYPTKAGGAPRSYVAYKKHANYGSESGCDAGAKLGTDTCTPSRYERVFAGGNVNIGSRSYHNSGQDCWLSTNSLYQNGRTECYWTDKRFSGWQNGLPDADAYDPRLREFGF